MSQKNIKLSRRVIKKAFTENELKFQKRFLLQCMKYKFSDRLRLCKIILFKKIKEVK
jgi:hypothetical protein